MAIGGAIGVGTTTVVSLASGVNPITGRTIFKIQLSDIDINNITREYKIRYGNKDISIAGDFIIENNVLNISAFDIDGYSTNQLGIKGVRDLTNNLGKYINVKEVHIYGAQRTTGANPGKMSIYKHIVNYD